MSSQPTTDMLLISNMRVLPLFPIKNQAIWRFYKQTGSQFWSANSIVVKGGKDVWNNTSAHEFNRIVLLCIDLLIYSHKQLHTDLLDLVQSQIASPEARCFFEYQNMMENTHVEALYGIRCNLTQDVDLAVIQTCWSDSFVEGLIDEKLEWSTCQTINASSIYEQIIALAASQRVFSASVYAILQWLVDGRDVNVPGLMRVLHLIGRDVDSHVNFATLIFHHLGRKPSRDQAMRIVKEIVEIEQRFATDLLTAVEVDPDGIWITKESMAEYIEHLGRTVVESMQYKAWNLTDNPYPWMLHADGETIMKSVQDMIQATCVVDRANADADLGQVESQSKTDPPEVVIVVDSD